jgi:hypothetical protein
MSRWTVTSGMRDPELPDTKPIGCLMQSSMPSWPKSPEDQRSRVARPETSADPGGDGSLDSRERWPRSTWASQRGATG